MDNLCTYQCVEGRVTPQKWSRLYAPPKSPLLSKTFGQVLNEARRNFSDLEAIIDIPQYRRLTFKELNTEVDQLAAGLLTIGIRRGDRLGIWGPSMYQWLAIEAAAAKAGIIVVPLNPASQSKELEYCINKTGINAIAFAENKDYYETILKIAPGIASPALEKLSSEACPTLSYLISLENSSRIGNAYTYAQLVYAGNTLEALEKLASVEREVNVHDVSCIYFTSVRILATEKGTTGQPKGAPLSHYAVVNSSFLVGKRLDCNEKDKICVPLLLCHSFSAIVATKLAPQFGSCLVIPCRSYNSTDVVKAIVEEKCTVIHGVPTMFSDMVKNPSLEKQTITTLRIAGCGGAPASEQLLKDAKARFNVKHITVGLIGIYGTTETLALTNGFQDDGDYLLGTTVGYPMDNLEVKIVNRHKEIVELETEGEICVRGYSVIKGYWNDPEKTNEVIDAAGWFHTGDSGVMLKSGHIRIVGRIKDIIIRGGENIAPQEIINVLQAHPEIEEAHVFGHPDERLGEVVAAWIRLKDGSSCTAESIKTFCKGKISTFKIPQVILFKQNFPKTALGKIQTTIVKKVTLEEVGCRNGK